MESGGAFCGDCPTVGEARDQRAGAQVVLKRLVITGCGHSGTAYAAALLRGAGLRCGHEAVFSHEPPVKWNGYDADASWLAAARLPLDSDVAVVHLVRDPLKVARSMHYFMQCDSFYHWWIQRLHPHVFELTDPVHRFVRHWTSWNAMVEGHAALRVQLETLGANDLRQILLLANRDDNLVEAALSSVLRGINTHHPVDAFASWDRLRRAPDSAAFLQMTERYGYVAG